MVFTRVSNPQSFIERKTEFSDTLVQRGAMFGAHCTLVFCVTIGAFAFIGAGAVINRDVPDYALVVGVPGQHIGWMSEYGEQRERPLTGDGTAHCKNTGKIYQLQDGIVKVLATLASLDVKQDHDEGSGPFLGKGFDHLGGDSLGHVDVKNSVGNSIGDLSAEHACL